MFLIGDRGESEEEVKLLPSHIQNSSGSAVHARLLWALCVLWSASLVKVIRVLHSVFPGIPSIEGSDSQRRVAALGILEVSSTC